MLTAMMLHAVLANYYATGLLWVITAAKAHRVTRKLESDQSQENAPAKLLLQELQADQGQYTCTMSLTKGETNTCRAFSMSLRQLNKERSMEASCVASH
mmetsp:Transcript_6811/g.12701  ORF Transcript_6811/g.12701 Transcript_6811/m.12701 type:complete len:99 (+) Transcript_6811:14-310(+)